MMALSGEGCFTCWRCCCRNNVVDIDDDDDGDDFDDYNVDDGDGDDGGDSGVLEGGTEGETQGIV